MSGLTARSGGRSEAGGANWHGELGLGDKQERIVPTQIPNLKAKQVLAGTNYTVIIDLNDNVWVTACSEAEGGAKRGVIIVLDNWDWATLKM